MSELDSIDSPLTRREVLQKQVITVLEAKLADAERKLAKIKGLCTSDPMNPTKVIDRIFAIARGEKKDAGE